MLGLANTTLDTNTASYRFLCTHSGTVSAIHFYLIISHTGYSGGTNGNVQVQLQTDDGSSGHFPSGKVLGTFLLTNANLVNFPIVSLTPAPVLVENTLYHLVFSNQDASPTVNYCSVDNLINSVATPSSPSQLTIADTFLAQLFFSTFVGHWQLRTGYTPIFEVDYADGHSQGQGYMESWIDSSAITVTGATMVREQFTVSQPSMQVNEVFFRTAPGGTGSMLASLQTAGGTVLASGTMLPASQESAIGWLAFSFPAVSLNQGFGYNMVFSSPSGSYSVWPIRRGVDQGFSSTTYFSDGYAQLNTGSGWIDFSDESGNPNQTDDDLQFFFNVV